VSAAQFLHVTRNALFNAFSDLPVSFPGKIEMLQKLGEMPIIHFFTILRFRFIGFEKSTFIFISSIGQGKSSLYPIQDARVFPYNLSQLFRILLFYLGQLQHDRFDKGGFITPTVIFFRRRDEIRGIGFD
jgi:hypothetical protein